MPTKPLTAVPTREGRGRRLDRAALVAAAAELVDRDGYDQLTLAALAVAVGVRAPSLYAHVASLQALKTEIVVLGLRELERDLVRACAGKAGAEAVRALCFAFRAFAERRPGVYLATMAWATHAEPAIAAASADVKASVLRALPAGVANGASDEQIHLLRTIWITLHGFLALNMTKSFNEPVSPDATFTRLVDQLADWALRP